VGVSFCGERGWAQGVLTTLAIGVHNVPEGLAKATLLVGQGASARQALAWSVATCLPQPLVAVPAFIFVEAFTALLPVALGFAAGCMIWMVFAELLPEALAEAPPGEVATAATLAAAGLEGLRMAFESLEGPGGVMASPLLPGAARALAPALAAMAPALAAAAAGGALVGGSALPAPLVLGFAAAAAAACGLAPLARLLLWAPDVPALHTLSGAAAGAALALLLRRQLLLAAAAGRRADAKSLGDLEGGCPADGHGSTNGGYATEGELLGGGAGAFAGGAVSRRADPGGPPSPSKAKGQPQPWLPGRGPDSRGDRRWSGPARAAGVVALAALLAQAVPLVRRCAAPQCMCHRRVLVPPSPLSGVPCCGAG
jgi:hypothetical protein